MNSILEYIANLIKTALIANISSDDKTFTHTLNKVGEANSANINMIYKDTDVLGYIKSGYCVTNGVHIIQVDYEDKGILPAFNDEIAEVNKIIAVILRTLRFDLSGTHYYIDGQGDIFTNEFFSSSTDGVEQQEDEENTVGNCAKYTKSFTLNLNFN